MGRRRSRIPLSQLHIQPRLFIEPAQSVFVMSAMAGYAVL